VIEVRQTRSSRPEHALVDQSEYDDQTNHAINAEMN